MTELLVKMMDNTAAFLAIGCDWANPRFRDVKSLTVQVPLQLSAL